LLQGIISRLKGKRDKSVRRVFNVSWWKLIVAIPLLIIAVIGWIVYAPNPSETTLVGMVALLCTGVAGFLIYFGINKGSTGFAFNGRKQTGRENAIVLLARRDEAKGKDVPRALCFAELKKIPRGAQRHRLRNLRKHFYEVFYNTATRRLEPVRLPDKKSFPPELFRLPAVMEPYKDALDYTPPSTLQKVAPGVLLLAIVIIGIIMVITMPPPGG